MTDNPTIVHPAVADRPPDRRAIGFAIGFFLICCAMVGVCWWAGGWTLGLFFGPTALFCIVLPQVTAILGRASHRSIAWLAASGATALLWYAALPDLPGITARQVGLALIVLSSFNLLLVAATDALLWSGIGPTSAAAIITVLSLAWLLWPIWLSTHLTGQCGESVANDLVWAHPLFAINATLFHFDWWDHYTIMYSTLSTLNQDVPYRVPASIWPAVGVHGIPAAAILLLHPLTARQKKLNRRDTEAQRNAMQ